MRNSFQNMDYFETYYFANIINNIILEPMPYLRKLDDWHGDLKYSKFLHPFPQFSALHDFIEHVLWSLIGEDISLDEAEKLSASPATDLWVNRALRYHGHEHITLHAWLEGEGGSIEEITEDDISDYHSYLLNEGPLEVMTDQMIDEVFFLMFGNRSFLGAFNRYVARCVISPLEMDGVAEDEEQLFDQDGVLKRVYMPEWVKKAVLYRDRGACGACNKDVSGLICIGNQKNFDHIVPLAQGGMNDVTNVQLLCEECNLKKGHANSFTSKQYERWY